MTASTIITDIQSVIGTFLNDHSLTSTDVLTDVQNTDLTDLIAAKLETLNPDHNYPPVKK